MSLLFIKYDFYFDNILKYFIFFLQHFSIYIKYMSVFRNCTRRPSWSFLKGIIDTPGYVET